MLFIQWGMIGFILIAACVAEFVWDKGIFNWSFGYWLVVVGALWAVSAGRRVRLRLASWESRHR